MKSILFLSILLFFAISLVNAQDVRFGIKGGASIANISGDLKGTESLQRLHLGVMMEARYNAHWALQPEILYSFQGFEADFGPVAHTFKFSYINVPVMIKYFPIDQLYVEAGPQIGFLHVAKDIADGPESNTDRDIKDGMRSNDLSLDVGIGLQFNNGFGIGARYDWGLTNITRKEAGFLIKNSVLQFYAAYFF